MEADSNKCNVLLISKYPDSVDVRFVITLALHIESPMVYNKPHRSPFKQLSMSYIQDSLRPKIRNIATANQSDSMKKLTKAFNFTLGKKSYYIPDTHMDLIPSLHFRFRSCRTHVGV